MADTLVRSGSAANSAPQNRGFILTWAGNVSHRMDHKLTIQSSHCKPSGRALTSAVATGNGAACSQ